MKVLVRHKLRKTRSGGYAERDEFIEAPVVRFGRGAECEIHMPDPRITLHHAELSLQTHSPVIESSNKVDLRVNETSTSISSLNPGDKVVIGPYDLLVLDLDELAASEDDAEEKQKITDCDVGFTLELSRPLGNDLNELKKRSDVNLNSAILSVRGWAWLSAAAVLVIALLAPLSAYLGKTETDKRELLSGEARPMLASADVLWKSGPHSGVHGFFGDKCDACHKEAFVQVQNDACIGCHQETRHHADPVEFPKASLDTHQCQSCHKEHREEPVPLTATHDSQCLTCHTKINAKFEAGHPFDNYPYERRTRIQFNHVSHFEKYFKDANNADKAPANCRGCHVPDDRGKFMVINGFAENCGACHGSFIADKPVELLALPGIDLTTLEDNEDLEDYDWRAGEWPINADNEEIPALMAVLLASDEEFAEAWEFILDEGTDMLDLSEASEEEIAAAETVALGVKRLIHGALTEGHEYLMERLESVSGAPLSDDTKRALLASLPLDLLTEAQSRWFPHLFDEMAAIEEDEIPEMADEMPDDHESPDGMMDGIDWAENGGWFIEDYTIKYKLTGHSDDLVQAWLGVSAGTASESETMAEFVGEFATPKGPGGCVACHSIDQHDSGIASVNWKSRRKVPHEVHQTEFVHSRHFSLVGEEGCENCHKINTEAAYSGAFEDWDPTTFQSNFTPIESATCAQCHQTDKVVTVCTDCHNFHVNPEFAGGKSAEISLNSQ